MIRFSQEEKKKRYNALPTHLREFMFSEEKFVVLSEIAEANHIDDAKLDIISSIIGYVVLGLIHPEDLAKEIEKEVGVDHRIAGSVTEGINRNILRSVLLDIHVLYDAPKKDVRGTDETESILLNPSFKQQLSTSQQIQGLQIKPVTEEMASTPAPETPQQPPPPASPQQEEESLEEKLAPPIVQAPPTPPVPQKSIEKHPPENVQPAPFVLQEESGLQPLAAGSMAPLERPHFFKSTVNEGQEEELISARLEIGQEEISNEPEVGRTQMEAPKVVNYTSPGKEANPFGNTPEQAKEVSPENIVNLKDLPK